MTDLEETFLVVGGDSLVGAGLCRSLQSRGRPAFSTTRRRATVGGSRVHLDFEDLESLSLPESVTYAFIVAGATNYERCEADPMAHHINVELIPRLVGRLLARKVFVTFISTNAVFGGERPWPLEDDPHAPGIAYARQKAAAERSIRLQAEQMRAEGLLNVVRLTKILDRMTSPLPDWFSTWARGDTVRPFSDLIFAPISVRYAGDCLATIGEKRVAGNLHLSGAENVTYVDFARALARRSGVDARRIEPTTAVEKGVHIAFKPLFSGLGMRRTAALCGFAPQTLDEVVGDLSE
jgi:dTDP-4-dehydrorhamnose reductase